VVCPTDRIDWLWNGDDVALNQDDLNRIGQVVDQSINKALAMTYTGSRALMVPDDPGIYQLVYRSGELCRRHIPTPSQIGMLQFVDGLAGARGDPPRMITDPVEIDEFLALPVIGQD
jgi:hypothetical protein